MLFLWEFHLNNALAAMELEDGRIRDHTHSCIRPSTRCS